MGHLVIENTEIGYSRSLYYVTKNTEIGYSRIFYNHVIAT